MVLGPLAEGLVHVGGLCLPGERLTAGPDAVGATQGSLLWPPGYIWINTNKAALLRKTISNSVTVSAWFYFRPFL